MDTCRMATVVDLFPRGTAKVKFNGEDEPSEKEYAFLARYVPAVGDYVLMERVGETWVIQDKVMHGEVISKVNYLELDESGGFDLSRTSGWQRLSNVEIFKDFMHTGVKLGFFGKEPIAKKTLSTVTASGDVTGDQVRTWINNIVNLLKAYGLC